MPSLSEIARDERTARMVLSMLVEPDDAVTGGLLHGDRTPDPATPRGCLEGWSHGQALPARVPRGRGARGARS